MDSVEKRARHRDKTDVFAEESEALDQIAKQVRQASMKLGVVASEGLTSSCHEAFISYSSRFVVA